MRTGSSSGRHARREEREGREGEGREKRKREKHWKREKEKKGKGEKKKRVGGGRIRAAIVAPVGHARRWSRARGQARHAGRGAQRDVTAGFRVKASSFGESGDRAGK